MTFIDQRQAKEISEWCDKHPEESKNYFKEHSELSQLFISKKISYAEFKKHSDELKIKYKYLDS